MQVHRNIDQLPEFRQAVVTIGTFDGVHLGHQQIIRQMKAEALLTGGETVIITFFPHPRYDNDNQYNLMIWQLFRLFLL